MENSKKEEYQKEIFRNRLLKNYKNLKKWASRNSVFCYRVYDKDIPELPFVLDLYNSVDGLRYLSFSLYKRPYQKDLDEEEKCLSAMSIVAIDVFNLDADNVFIKVRERKKGASQYEKLSPSRSTRFIVREGNALFYINISDYIDTGLFLDHRPLRFEIAKTSFSKDVLNLFCYTASFSVHAILNGARSVCSVDFSKTALKRAKENYSLNGIEEGDAFSLIRSEVRIFLDDAINSRKKWDIIVCDPPTFSNSSSSDWKDFFDVAKCYIDLCKKCLKLLNDGGILYFSTTSKHFKFDAELLKSSVEFPIFIKDISLISIPFDFRNKKIHKTWKIVKDEVR